MRSASLILVAALSLPVIASPSVDVTPSPSLVAVSSEVPGTEYRRPDPTYPENQRPDPATWDDTADTSDEVLESDVDTVDVESERDLNNDVHDPLLESPIFDTEPLEAPLDPEHDLTTDPWVDPWLR